MHRELEIGYPTFDENKLSKVMLLLITPSSLLVFGNYQVNHRTIKLTKEDDTNYTVSFIGVNGYIIHPSLPMKYHRALFFTFRDIYLLHIYEQGISKILEGEGIILSDEDINSFLK